MTAPVQTGMTAGQLAALLALVQAQAAVRQQLTQAAVNAAVAAFTALAPGDWWDARAINRAIATALRVVQPSQRQAALVTDAYLARVGRIMTGRPFRTVGPVDITSLRRTMTDEIAREILRGVIEPVFLELGSPAQGPAGTIDAPTRMAIRDDPRARIVPPEEPYGRVADQYRSQVAGEARTELDAQRKALVRIAAIAQTDVTNAVRAQYEKGLRRSQITGWRRILHPEMPTAASLAHGRPPPPVCALCVVAADRTYGVEDLMPIHDNCRCEVLPVIGELDPGITLNRDDLNALYAAAGGTGGDPTRQAGHLKDVKVVLAEHGELGPVLIDGSQHYRGPREVAEKMVDPVAAKRHQLEWWIRASEQTLRRESAGEDVATPLAFQRRRIAQLERELAAV